MKTDARRIRQVVLTASAVAMGTVAVAGAVPAGAAPGPGPDAKTNPRTRTIAAATVSNQLLVTVTAVRSTTDEFAASVRLTTFAKIDHQWRLQDRRLVGKKDSWFWFPLTGPQSVCEFSTASVKPQRIRLSLLVTPSIGCSPVHRFHIRDGKLVTG